MTSPTAWKQQPGVAGDQGAAAVREESIDVVADGEFGDTGPDFDDDAGTFATDQRVVGEHAQRDHDVAEVGGDCPHVHPDLAGFQRRATIRHRFELEVLEGARGGQTQPPRPVDRRYQNAVDCPAAVHPRGVDRVAAQHDLRLADRQGVDDRRITQRRIGIH